jgi:hypothetical protein
VTIVGPSGGHRQIGDRGIQDPRLDSPLDATTVGAAAGVDGPAVQVQLVGVIPGGQFRIVVLFIDRTVLKKGADLPFDVQQVFAVVGTVVGDNNDFSLLGLLHKGTLHVEDAGPNEGDPVVASFTAEALGPAN